MKARDKDVLTEAALNKHIEKWSGKAGDLPPVAVGSFTLTRGGNVGLEVIVPTTKKYTKNGDTPHPLIPSRTICTGDPTTMKTVIVVPPELVQSIIEQSVTQQKTIKKWHTFQKKSKIKVKQSNLTPKPPEAFIRISKASTSYGVPEQVFYKAVYDLATFKGTDYVIEFSYSKLENKLISEGYSKKQVQQEIIKLRQFGMVFEYQTKKHNKTISMIIPKYVHEMAGHEIGPNNLTVISPYQLSQAVKSLDEKESAVNANVLRGKLLEEGFSHEQISLTLHNYLFNNQIHCESLKHYDIYDFKTFNKKYGSFVSQPSKTELKQMPMHDQVYFVLQDLQKTKGHVSVKEIADKLGKTTTNIRYHLKKLIKEQKITSHTLPNEYGGTKTITLYHIGQFDKKIDAPKEEPKQKPVKNVHEQKANNLIKQANKPFKNQQSLIDEITILQKTLESRNVLVNDKLIIKQKLRDAKDKVYGAQIFEDWLSKETSPKTLYFNEQQEKIKSIDAISRGYATTNDPYLNRSVYVIRVTTEKGTRYVATTIVFDSSDSSHWAKSTVHDKRKGALSRLKETSNLGRLSLSQLDKNSLLKQNYTSETGDIFATFPSKKRR